MEGLRPTGGQDVAPDRNTSVGAISGAMPDILRGRATVECWLPDRGRKPLVSHSNCAT